MVDPAVCDAGWARGGENQGTAMSDGATDPFGIEKRADPTPGAAAVPVELHRGDPVDHVPAVGEKREREAATLLNADTTATGTHRCMAHPRPAGPDAGHLQVAITPPGAGPPGRCSWSRVRSRGRSRAPTARRESFCSSPGVVTRAGCRCRSSSRICTRLAGCCAGCCCAVPRRSSATPLDARSRSCTPGSGRLVHALEPPHTDADHSGRCRAVPAACSASRRPHSVPAAA